LSSLAAGSAYFQTKMLLDGGEFSQPIGKADFISHFSSTKGAYRIGLSLDSPNGRA